MVRAVHNERDSILGFLDAQRNALRRSVHGLTEQQCAQSPTASSLSLAVLLKHAATVERNWTRRIAGDRAPETDAGLKLASSDTVPSLLDDYAAAAAETDAMVRDLPGLDQPVNLSTMHPVMPEGIIRTARWIMLHLIEETARHAGHADIIRETLDGTTTMDLVQATGEPLIPENA